ncbi:MAG TPA: enoyl-CoA hydratase/isomerase family protein [Kiloniellales bacterium]
MVSTVESRTVGGIAEITLNRPHRLNAINDELLRDLSAALEAANADPAAAVILLSGAGRAFCAGDDLKEFASQARGEAAARAYLERLQEVTRLLVFGDKLVVGAIHGWAVGGGFEWLLDCDLVVMADGTRCFFPEASLGLFVTGGASHLLPRLVGLPKAKELVLLGERIDARQALALGLANWVVPEAERLAKAREVAGRLAALPPRPRRQVKALFTRAPAVTLEEALALETEATLEGFLDPDTARRAAAAIE